MTISIKTNDDGKVQSIYQGELAGDNWVQLPDEALPSVSQDNISKIYWYDGQSLTVETEPIPEDDGLI